PLAGKRMAGETLDGGRRLERRSAWAAVQEDDRIRAWGCTRTADDHHRQRDVRPVRSLMTLRNLEIATDESGRERARTGIEGTRRCLLEGRSDGRKLALALI